MHAIPGKAAAGLISCPLSGVLSVALSGALAGLSGDAEFVADPRLFENPHGPAGLWLVPAQCPSSEPGGSSANGMLWRTGPVAQRISWSVGLGARRPIAKARLDCLDLSGRSALCWQTTNTNESTNTPSEEEQSTAKTGQNRGRVSGTLAKQGKCFMDLEPIHPL